MIYKPQYKISISGSELRHELGISGCSNKNTHFLTFSQKFWLKEDLNRIRYQKKKPEVSPNRPYHIRHKVDTIVHWEPLQNAKHINSLTNQGLIKIPSSVVCVGDGSGGIGSCCLRMYPSLKLMFNS